MKHDCTKMGEASGRQELSWKQKNSFWFTIHLQNNLHVNVVWWRFDIWDVGVSQNNNGCRRKGKKSWPGKGVEVIKLKATCWKKGRKRPMREKFRNGRWEAGSEKDKWRGQWSKQMDTLKEILGRWRRLGGKAEGRDVAKMDREHCAQRQRLA